MDFMGLNKSSVQKEPEWVINPLSGITNGKLAATGCARTHVRGVEAQKKLAIQRGIDQIAMQLSTKVSVVSYRKKQASSGNNISSKLDSSSLQEVENVEVSTKVKAFYKRVSTGEICAWVVQN